MYSIILAIVVVIGLYFIYNQISNLNMLLENIIQILRNNKAAIKENSNKIIDDIEHMHTQSNTSIFNPETLLSKFMGGDTLNNNSNIEQVDDEEEIDEEEIDEEEIDEEEIDDEGLEEIQADIIDEGEIDEEVEVEPEEEVEVEPEEVEAEPEEVEAEPEEVEAESEEVEAEPEEVEAEPESYSDSDSDFELNKSEEYSSSEEY